MPSNPATRSNAADLSDAEASLDVSTLVEETVNASEILHLREAVAWEEMPVPAR
jgi:hypothetical protein